MRIYIDDRMIKRKSHMSKIMVAGGLMVLVAGLAISFLRPQEVFLTFGAVLLGFALSQGGNQLFVRWGRRPRIDEIIGSALKGLDDRYSLFHYSFGINHFLISPAGIMVLLPRGEEGVITYSGGRWYQDRPKRGIFRRGGLISLGDLEKSSKTPLIRLRQSLSRALPEIEDLEITPLLVFVHPQATIRADSSPITSIHLKKLKSWIRRSPKSRTLPKSEVQRLAQAAGFG